MIGKIMGAEKKKAGTIAIKFPATGQF